MPAVPHLRSPYASLDRLVYVGRMFDKIRLHARGELPTDYQAALGKGLDARACAFLQVDYEALCERVRQGGSDEDILAWVWTISGTRSEHDCTIWSWFLQKLAWRDDRSAYLRNRIAEQSLEGRGIETFFDLIEVDEGRPIGGPDA